MPVAGMCLSKSPRRIPDSETRVYVRVVGDVVGVVVSDEVISQRRRKNGTDERRQNNREDKFAAQSTPDFRLLTPVS